MKKTLLILLISAAALFTPTGCSKSSTASNIISAIPDITNFLVQASATFIANAPALIHILSSTLGNGTFNINYTLGGGYNIGSGTATLTMNGGSGTFSTSTLSSGGPTTVTVTSVTNTGSGGGSATPSGNNVSSIFDSTGLMNATYTPSGGSAQTLKATDVTASLAGSLLTIHGVIWTPNLTTITLYNDIYAGATGTVAFNSNDLSASGPTSTFNGSAAYGVAGSSGTIADLSSWGSITLSTTSPLLTGSFTYKNQDSSVVSGTFSCPHP